MKEFGGKVAVVTGGGQGIGRALIERFTDEGMKAVVADVVPALVEQTTAELRDQGREVIGVVTDVTSLESAEALRDATLDAFGAVHLVCNNAGIGSGSEGQIWEHHVNDWRWSLDVNVMGVVNGINAFVPTLLASGEECHVVNTTSGNGGFTPLITPITFTSSDQRQSFTWWSQNWPSEAEPIPALLHTTCTAPNASSVASRNASTEARSVTSVTTPITSRP